MSIRAQWWLVGAIGLSACGGNLYADIPLQPGGADPILQGEVRRAIAGDRAALLALGKRYETGTGVRKDLRKAEKIYNKAAAAHNAISWVYIPSPNNSLGQVVPYKRKEGKSGEVFINAKLIPFIPDVNFKRFEYGLSEIPCEEHEEKRAEEKAESYLKRVLSSPQKPNFKCITKQLSKSDLMQARGKNKYLSYMKIISTRKKINNVCDANFLNDLGKLSLEGLQIASITVGLIKENCENKSNALSLYVKAYNNGLLYAEEYINRTNKISIDSQLRKELNSLESKVEESVR